MKDIAYKEKYIDDELLKRIKDFLKETNDTLHGKPYEATGDGASHLKKEGCADIPLRLDYPNNPINEVIEKLKKDTGDFFIHESSIRYLYYPYTAHSDVRSSEVMIENKKKYRHGYTFLIPLSWKSGYVPGTAFFDSPPKEGQDLYIEHQAMLPKFQNERMARNFGIEQLITWKNPGDLIMWMNYRWHCTMNGGSWVYNEEEWCKEFISLETYKFKDDIK